MRAINTHEYQFSQCALDYTYQASHVRKPQHAPPDVILIPGLPRNLSTENRQEAYLASKSA